MNVYTFDFLTESQDFDHNETFVLESDMIQECSHRQKQIEQLKQQLEEAVEVVKFYSIPENTGYSHELDDNVEWLSEDQHQRQGLKARQFLAKHRRENG